MHTAVAPPAAVPVARRDGTAVRRTALALAAGLALFTAFPPVDLWPLAPVGVALLLVACRGASPRRGTGLGLVCGLTLFGPLLGWTSAVAGPVPFLALALLQAVFVAALGGALAVVGRLPGWPVWSALLWVAQEALRDRVPFGGFPWGRLAFSQGHTVLTPLAALGGAPLVTFAVALVGSALALLLSRPRGPALLGLGPALLVLLVGPLVPTPTGGPAGTVAVVQGNVPRLGLDVDAQRSAVLRNHVAATEQLAADVRAGRAPRPDLVVWPENASDLDPYADAEAAALIRRAVRDVGVPVLVGAVVRGPRPGTLLNRGVLWDPVRGPGESYDKQHPVPFGEYIPLRPLARRLSSKVDLVPQDFAAGSHSGLLRSGPFPLADVICFEVAYDGLVRAGVQQGGRLIVVQTNNASYGRSGETYQQLAMGRLRAVEHGRAVLVAATSGISAVVGPDGRLQARTGIFSRQVLVARVPLRTGSTWATRLGVLPELGLALAGGLALLTALVRR